MKKIIFSIITATILSAVSHTTAAQENTATIAITAKPIPLPVTDYNNKIEFRSEFSSHTSRANSDTGNRKDDWNYIYLTDYTTTSSDNCKIHTATIEIPDYWADRIVIMHSEGARNSHIAKVNSIMIGSSRDSGIPSQFNITPYLRRGSNTITIEIPSDTSEPESGLKTNRPNIETWFLYSQPRNRIVNYKVSSEIMKSGDGELLVDVIVENDYRGIENFNVGFDIFSPEGRLEEYGIKEMTMEGLSRDTIRFRAVLYGAGKRVWSTETPNTYHLTLFIGKDGRILEYIPSKIGFGRTEYKNGAIYRNDKKIEINHQTYNASTPEKLRKDISRLKKEGFNTLLPDYPQPLWFYEICTQSGIYVIDQININSAHQPSNLRIGGTPSNAPKWLPEYMERTKATYYRSLNHPCIIAWSLGNDSGNGYNLYKTYLWLKEQDPSRAVIYRDANGDWNNDITLR